MEILFVNQFWNITYTCVILKNDCESQNMVETKVSKFYLVYNGFCLKLLESLVQKLGDFASLCKDNLIRAICASGIS